MGEVGRYEREVGMNGLGSYDSRILDLASLTNRERGWACMGIRIFRNTHEETGSRKNRELDQIGRI